MLELATHTGRATLALSQAVDIRWSYLQTISFMSAVLFVPLPSLAPLSLGPINKCTHTKPSDRDTSPLLLVLLHMHFL